jgi:Fe-S cluster biogenesis protein NfuA
MADPIRIQAEPVDVFTCAFTVDRPLMEGRVLRFADREKAKGSPLAEAVFAVPGIVSFSVSGSKLTVKKEGTDEWIPLARQIGAALRERLQSGQPLFAESALQASPQDAALRGRVQALIDTEINPVVAGHGGHIELVDVQGGTVYIHMSGGCQGCGMADVTLKQGVERLIRQQIPEIAEVSDVTDHSTGSNPYYSGCKK